MSKWLLMNIGCIECGVSSAIVGVFDDESVADRHAARLGKSHEWREGGQNHYEVFAMPDANVVASEYAESLEP